jgi:hypothetical protein
MKQQRVAILISVLWVGAALPVAAGPYATMAAQVKAHGGVVTVVAMGGLESQGASALDATAVSMCHTITAEGVVVTAVQFVTQTSQIVRVVSGATLKSC